MVSSFSAREKAKEEKKLAKQQKKEKSEAAKKGIVTDGMDYIATRIVVYLYRVLRYTIIPLLLLYYFKYLSVYREAPLNQGLIQLPS